MCLCFGLFVISIIQNPVHFFFFVFSVISSMRVYCVQFVISPVWFDVLPLCSVCRLVFTLYACGVYELRISVSFSADLCTRFWFPPPGDVSLFISLFILIIIIVFEISLSL